ncbi:MAG TPA: DUF1501 domain-containing protein [Pirellulales bacterium]|nr:DUF1501 domain-containing protein [Pirellulales bacterium]
MDLSEWVGVQERRRFLRQSACGLGMLALADLLKSETRGDGAQAIESPAPKLAHFTPRAKSVIFLFMAGAPSQLDLFDPKPEMRRLHGQPVPESYLKTLDDALIKGSATVMASPRDFTRHGECGMDFSDFVPHLGLRADDLCMIRSMVTHVSNHDPGQLLMNCGTTLFGHPAMGSWVTYGLGSESQNLPAFVVLLSNSGKGVDGGAALWSNGFLPSSYRGVTFRNQGDPILHLSSPTGVSHATQRARLSAIRDMNQLRRRQTGEEEIASRIAAYELAYRMQATAPELVDFSRESAATLEMYGLTNETTRWFGSNCLLARRMVERGVRFVQLYHSTWDDHNDLNKNLKTNCDMTDQPAAALLQDLKQRGLLDETLLVWGGEFGRTPMNEVRRGNTAGHEGRDHHPFGFTMLMAGGGIRGGQIVGKTDELGYHAVEDRIHVHDLQATILHCLGLDHTRLTYRHQGRNFRLTDVEGSVVEKLLV